MTVWVTTADRQRFVMRVVKTGLMRDGFTEIQEGLQMGELVVIDGTLFIANQFANAAS